MDWELQDPVDGSKDAVVTVTMIDRVRGSEGMSNTVSVAASHKDPVKSHWAGEALAYSTRPRLTWFMVEKLDWVMYISLAGKGALKKVHNYGLS